ncbi:zinc-binding dehydrogenase [Streptomyces niveus]|uniref:zinc-binding dehydrogenase n=1 Tax=Streptomyces niveus TaxID=193462 RepID=UPI00369A4D9A
MKGYVIQEKGRADWQEVPVPEIGPYDALVRPTAVATCTTDVHLIDSLSLPNALGKVIGHEAVGVVERVGDLVTDFAPGDRVVLPAGLADWRHPRAQRGEGKYHQSKSPYFSDDPANGGWFSELVKCFEADSNLAHIPDSVTDVQAVSVDDMAATGFTGVERMEIQFGEVVVVLGVGPVGLMGVAAAALRGAGRIIAVGSRPNTMTLATRYGATDLADYKRGDVYEQIMTLTGGAQVDSVLVASGGNASDQIGTAMRLTKFGGHVSVVSGFFDDESVTIPMDVWNYGVMEKFLTAAQANQGRDYMERLLLLIANGKLDTQPLATHVLHGWDNVGQSLELMRSRDRSVIKPVVVVG